MLCVFVGERRREEILDVLKRCYYTKKQRNVPIFYATSKDLREFTTTEKDMKKEIARFPTPNYRTNEEDLFDGQDIGEEASGGKSLGTDDEAAAMEAISCVARGPPRPRMLLAGWAWHASAFAILRHAGSQARG